MIPSPQAVEQAEGLVPVQVQPVSVVQVLEQPSPGVRFPSSQISVPDFTPSPQVVEQVEGLVPAQTQPDSMVQVSEQPSPGVAL
jgi:hypothetical protein